MFTLLLMLLHGACPAEAGNRDYDHAIERLYQRIVDTRPVTTAAEYDRLLNRLGDLRTLREEASAAGRPRAADSLVLWDSIHALEAEVSGARAAVRAADAAD